jgi:hypothetical protein
MGACMATAEDSAKDPHAASPCNDCCHDDAVVQEGSSRSREASSEPRLGRGRVVAVLAGPDTPTRQRSVPRKA